MIISISSAADDIVIIREIGSKSCAQRFFVDRDDVIEAFSADRSNQALDIGGLPGGSGCGNHLLDPQFFQLRLNDLAIDAISIPDYVLRNGVIWKGVKKLLRSPFCGGMRRNIEMNNAATLMRENEEDVENAEGDCRDCEEINRGKLFAVVFQKGAPCLGGRFGMSDHVFSDSCLGDIDSEFEQFAMNSGGSPEGIIFAHGVDEITNILGNPGPSRFAMPAFPGPKQTESFAMPGEHSFGFNNDEGRAPLRPEEQKPNPEESVPRSEFWAVSGTFQDDDLVPQSENLGLESES